MSNFKASDRIQWKDTPCSDKGEITHVCNFGGITVFWDSQPFEEYYYTAKDVEKFELLFQKPADLPKYIIVEDRNKERFESRINKRIAEGYKPQGGVAVDQEFYIQALILEK